MAERREKGEGKLTTKTSLKGERKKRPVLKKTGGRNKKRRRKDR